MRNLGPFQTISIFGIIFSAAAQITLMLLDKQVNNFWFLYPTWVFIFFVGWLLQKYGKTEDHHH